MDRPLDKKDFRNAMARLGAAVNIVTTDGPAGRAGFTASAVCSVTDDPPTLLVCMNRGSSAAAAVQGNGVLCVNTLGRGHEDISNAFAGFTGLEGAERFNHGDWDKLGTGAPALRDAAVSFDCQVTEVLEKGTHLVLFAAVLEVRVSEAVGGLIYYSRGYHVVG
jgi:flavin reductase